MPVSLSPRHKCLHILITEVMQNTTEHTCKGVSSVPWWSEHVEGSGVCIESIKSHS